MRSFGTPEFYVGQKIALFYVVHFCKNTMRELAWKNILFARVSASWLSGTKKKTLTNPPNQLVSQTFHLHESRRNDE